MIPGCVLQYRCTEGQHCTCHLGPRQAAEAACDCRDASGGRRPGSSSRSGERLENRRAAAHPQRRRVGYARPAHGENGGQRQQHQRAHMGNTAAPNARQGGCEKGMPTQRNQRSAVAHPSADEFDACAKQKKDVHACIVPHLGRRNQGTPQLWQQPCRPGAVSGALRCAYAVGPRHTPDAMQPVSLPAPTVWRLSSWPEANHAGVCCDGRFPRRRRKRALLLCPASGIIPLKRCFS